MNARPWAAAACAALCLIACGEEQPPPAPARFDRPNAVAFACVQDDDVVASERCQAGVEDNGQALYALVTQSARGEIAAVNLQTGTVVDNRRDIPGFTFVPVGEMPVAVVVPPQNPDFTYVADYGSRDVRVLRTDALVSPLGSNPLLQTVRIAIDAAGKVDVVEPEDDLSGLTVIAPTDLVLAPDESGLVVAAPDSGRVFWLPIERCAGETTSTCEEGLIDKDGVLAVPLETSRDRLVTSMPGDADPERYEELCGFERAAPPPATPLDIPDDVLMNPPRPIALAVDADCPSESACAPRVLVADDGLPIIHAVDLDALASGDTAGAVLSPLVSGAPTRAVAVTPWVPASINAGGEAQYVYAIDAVDGSVLVMQDGQVLNVNDSPLGRPDRIAFQTTAAATALTIATPDFDPAGGAEQWLPGTAECIEDENPATLHGVFLAAALTDGTVRIVDIHDMELRDADPGEPATPCRQCPSVEIPVLVRHQPRLATNFKTVEGEDPPSTAPVANTLFRTNGLPIAVRDDGSTGSPEAPGLECIDCGSGLVQAFPTADTEIANDGDADAGVDDGEPDRGCSNGASALVCAAPDPWADDETWFAVYEGLIPGTSGRLGTLVPEPGTDAPAGGIESVSGATEFVPQTPLDFCEAGVLGEDDIAPSFEGETCDSQEAADQLFGDQLVIISPPISAERADELYPADDQAPIRERCAAVREALGREDAQPIGFEIRRAYRDRLVLKSRLAHEVGGASTFDEITDCLEPGPLAFDVRALNQLAVQGARSGFLSDVRASAAGRCQVDPEADPLRQGRARLGCTYRNAAVQFRIHRPETGEIQPPPLLEFLVQPLSPATKLQVVTSSSGFGNVTVVAVQLRFNPLDGRLYLVDVHGRGLTPISLAPLPFVAPTSFN